ncbi:hypothetical protein [Saccharothrix sp. ST-888]|uniref:hypothetical protein n=1 Tax=Saccharothrix sp. ST-888 TaxID=1427391 RepID=UPI0005ECC499|nr:hypothetical protein [Saccharothrix sp. ST-888]KJK57829.1 hypothetical protein UK12_14000 [Saccharothrix sp. ST-888]
MDDFREVLSDELSLEPPPPLLGGMIEEAARAGRRTRRVRMWTAVAGSATAIAVVAVLLGVVTNKGPAAGGGPARLDAAAGSGAPAVPQTSGAASAAAPSAAPSTALPPTSGASPTVNPASSRTGVPGTPPDDGKVPATAPGLLQQLLSLLPPGQTSHYAGNGGDEPLVQTYLTTAAGTGMIRLSVHPIAGRMVCDGGTPKCVTDAAGRIVQVYHMEGNCVQSTGLLADRGDGTVVQIDLGSCLNYQDDRNRPGVQALTVEQAIAIAENPAVSTRLDRTTVLAGAARFPDLPALF